MVNVRPHRLYAKARILGFRRAKRNVREHTTLVQVEGCQTPKDADFYCGKRIAYVYRAKREIDGSRIRVVWGRVTRSHGNSGVVRAKFAKNLPPKSFGASARIVRFMAHCVEDVPLSHLNLFFLNTDCVRSNACLILTE